MRNPSSKIPPRVSSPAQITFLQLSIATPIQVGWRFIYFYSFSLKLHEAVIFLQLACSARDIRIASCVRHVTRNWLRNFAKAGRLLIFSCNLLRIFPPQFCHMSSIWKRWLVIDKKLIPKCTLVCIEEYLVNKALSVRDGVTNVFKI